MGEPLQRDTIEPGGSSLPAPPRLGASPTGPDADGCQAGSSRGGEAPVPRLLRPGEIRSDPGSDQLAPPRVGDAAQLLELLAFPAPERRAIPPGNDHETRGVEGRPGDVPGTDQPRPAGGNR